MKSRPTILVADDDERIRLSISDILLAQRYKVVQAQNGREALQKVDSESPDVILLDIHMPEMDGIDVIKKLKDDGSKRLIPIVVVSGADDVGLRIQALKLGADDFLSKPPHIAELTARVRSLVKVKAYNDYMRHYRSILEEEVRKRSKELNEAHERLSEAHEKLKNASLDTIYCLSTAAEYKDEDTAFHLQRVSNYAAAIARKIGLDNGKVDSLLYSAPMHDIGKIGIPDRILLKPGKLDSAEWEFMKQHTVFGGQILEGVESDFIKMGREIALSHHEKWDGSGYPNGLQGEIIPIEGRVTAVADVFDALTTKRPYKVPFSNEQAFEIIQVERSSHFDPELVDAFFAIQDQILEIQGKYRDDGKNVSLELAGDDS